MPRTRARCQGRTCPREYQRSRRKAGACASEPRAQIDAAGTLRFTPRQTQKGTATLTVYARDTGGTEHGGVAESAPQTFTNPVR
jgi:hypothetical protein